MKIDEVIDKYLSETQLDPEWDTMNQRIQATWDDIFATHNITEIKQMKGLIKKMKQLALIAKSRGLILTIPKREE